MSVIMRPDLLRVHRLDQVVVEAGLPGRGGGRRPGPSRSGPRARAGERGPRAEPAGDLVAVHPGQADVEEDDLGPEFLGRRQGRGAVVGEADLVPVEPSGAGPGCRPRRRCRPRPGCARRRPRRGVAPIRRGGSRPRLGPAGQRRQPDDELAALPGPSLRASTVPPCISTRLLTRVRPMPSPPCERSSESVDLGEQLEDPRQHARRRCRCRCRAPGRPPRRPRDRPSSQIWPPGSVYLAALFSRLQSTCSSRVGSASSRIGSAGRRDGQLVAAAARSAGGASRRRWPTTAASSTGSLRSSILPRLIRETSSRSSTSRAMCCTCRSAIDRAASTSVRLAARQPHQLQGVADRGQRVAQLVGEHGQELVLAAVGLPQGRLHLHAIGDVDGHPADQRRPAIRSRNGEFAHQGVMDQPRPRAPGSRPSACPARGTPFLLRSCSRNCAAVSGGKTSSSVLP